MQITIRMVVRNNQKHVELWKNGKLSKIKQTKNPLKETVKILKELRATEE